MTAATHVSPSPSAVLADHAAQVRRLALTAIYRAGSGHPGGALSAADIITCLYRAELRIRPDQPDWPDRDRFVLSKGHSCPALYGALADAGLIERDLVPGFRGLGSPLQGHPFASGLPWIEASTGSLGQGFSQAIGMAIGLRHAGRDARVYVMLGDGELQEGEVWEGAMSAAHYRLSNLCAIVDYNKLQSDNRPEAIMGLEPLGDKWRAFGWNVIAIDGHSIPAILAAFDYARAHEEGPTVILADTVKGQGVSFMADAPNWHGSVKIRDQELELALVELGAEAPEIAWALAS
ncbi:MAG: transketolase [Alphaproteobacteria bacterium]